MLRIELITPDGPVFEGDADGISLPTPDGEITVLPHHIPLISIVVPGSITVRQGREEKLFAVSRGVIEVAPSTGSGQATTVRILADSADRADELQEEAIERAKADAEKLASERRHDAAGFADATALLEKELARLQVVRRHRSKKRI